MSESCSKDNAPPCASGKINIAPETATVESSHSMLRLEDWRRIRKTFANLRHRVKIAIVGKYILFPDTYRSLLEALHHGGFPDCIGVDIFFVDAEALEENTSTAYISETLKDAHAIVVPGGFGVRGVEGMIRSITYAREKNIPFLGICFGMQLAVIESIRQLPEFCRATSSEFYSDSIEKLGDSKEFSPCVVGLLTEWMDGDMLRVYSKRMGGTMRLGAYECTLNPKSRIAAIYKTNIISERHRHRYEVNNQYLEVIEKSGIIIAGTHGVLVECIERHDHMWFAATQFHPEFKSRPFAPHPLFVSFVGAALEYQKTK